MDDYKYGLPAKYVEETLARYREGRISFRELNMELDGAGSQLSDIIYDNLPLFKGRVEDSVVGLAALDGGRFYYYKDTERYLEAGLPRQVLIDWLVDDLPYEWFTNDGAESEDFWFDDEILRLCQLLSSNEFTVEEIERVLNSLKEEAKVFFWMLTEQYDEYSAIGINVAKYAKRAAKYPHFAKNVKFKALLDLPDYVQNSLVKKVFKLYSLKETWNSINNKDMRGVIGFLSSRGVRIDTIARKYVAEIGYNNPSKEEASFGHDLVKEAEYRHSLATLKILDVERIDKNWREYHPSPPDNSIKDKDNNHVSRAGSCDIWSAPYNPGDEEWYYNAF